MRAVAIRTVIHLTVLLVAGAMLFASAAWADDAPVVIVRIAGTINPATADLLAKAVRSAEDRHAKALVVEIDTPGGLLPSMQSMVETLLAAKVPTISYVTPQGGGAMSAGVFVTMAAHIAAMTPGTTIGAAHPISATGDAIQGPAGEKIENFAVSLARAIAEQRNRNARWAEQAVRESVAITDREAVTEHVVDLSSSDLDSLLRDLEGRTVTVNGAPVTLSGLAAAPRERFEMTLKQQMLNFLADPNVAVLLGLGAMLGLGIEIFHPGAMIPGIVGAICLVLALVSGQIVPISIGGLALLVLGAVFFGLEMTVPSFGAFGVAGIVCLVVGSLYFIDDGEIWSGEKYAVHRSLIGTVAGIVGLLLFGVVNLAVGALRTKVTTGSEGLVGRQGKVLTDFSAVGQIFTGKVRVAGEIWSAETEETRTEAGGAEAAGIEATGTLLKAGDRVEVVRMLDGLRMVVRRLAS